MGLFSFLLLPEFGMVEMVGILVDGDLHAPPGVQDNKLVVDKDMPIMAPVGTASALRFGMQDAKFERYLAGIDSQELFREVVGGFVGHTVFFSAKKQSRTAEAWQGYTKCLSINEKALPLHWSVKTQFSGLINRCAEVPARVEPTFW